MEGEVSVVVGEVEARHRDLSYLVACRVGMRGRFGVMGEDGGSEGIS